MPLISVIIPVYKVEPYIRECLDSVTAQTFTDYECILIDDGSPDNCPAICDEYASQYPQMKVIHKKNGGLSDARNTGIRAAKGDYIVLLDSDDLFASKEALKDLANVMVKTNAPVIFNSNLTVFSDNYKKSYDGLKAEKNCFTPICFYKTARSNSRLLLAGWLFVVRRGFLLMNDLFFKVGIFHEDEHWFPRVSAAADIVAVNHRLFYSYRQERIGSITATITKKHLYDVIYIINEFIETAKTTKSNLLKKILSWRAADIWVAIYMQLPEYFDNSSTECKDILYGFNKTKNILLKGRNVKYILFRIGVLIFGIDRFYNIKRIRSILKRKRVYAEN
jgi:glycosyltransferase involved in cell wall biosynthesis